MQVSFVARVKLTPALAHYAPTRQTEVKIDIETPYVMWVPYRSAC